MIESIRTKALWAVIVLALLVVPLAVVVSPWWWLLEILFVPLVLLGIYDYFQPRHSILRNYPLAGRMRFLLEGMGPGAAPVPRGERHRRPPVRPGHPIGDLRAGQERR